MPQEAAARSGIFRAACAAIGEPRSEAGPFQHRQKFQTPVRGPITFPGRRRDPMR